VWVHGLILCERFLEKMSEPIRFRDLIEKIEGDRQSAWLKEQAAFDSKDSAEDEWEGDSGVRTVEDRVQFRRALKKKAPSDADRGGKSVDEWVEAEYSKMKQENKR